MPIGAEMPPINELEVTSADLEAAAAEINSEAAEDAVIEQAAQIEEALDDNIEVPESDFWDETPAGEMTTESTDAVGDESTSDANAELTPEPTDTPDGEFTYKANGKEHTITLEEAKKRIALADGARQKISEAAKTKRALAKVKGELKESKKYQENWEQLEELKGDRKKLLEVITGESYDDIIKEEVERARTYEDASTEERQLLDYETRMRVLEQDNERTRRGVEKDKKTAEDKLYNANLKEMRTKLHTELSTQFRASVPTDNPQVSNKLFKLAMQGAVNDLKQYHKDGIDAQHPKTIRKAVKDQIATLEYYFKDEVKRSVTKATDSKKKAAKEKAQLASTRSYSKPVTVEDTKLNPLDFFHANKRR
jgi:hypothetical protein